MPRHAQQASEGKLELPLMSAAPDARTLGGGWLSRPLRAYGFSDDKRCPWFAAALVVAQAVVAVGMLFVVAQLSSTGLVGDGGTTIQLHPAAPGVPATLSDPAFGDALGTFEVAADCCGGAGDEAAALASHHPAGCIAPRCVPFFAANAGWAAALAKEGHRWALPNATAQGRVTGWQCGGSWDTSGHGALGDGRNHLHDEGWSAFAHASCDVQLAPEGGPITVPRLCTPVYYCHKLRAEDEFVGLGFLSAVTFAGLSILGLADRWLVLRVARAFPLRVDATMRQIEGGSGGQQQRLSFLGGGGGASDDPRILVRARIAGTLRALTLWTWLPLAVGYGLYLHWSLSTNIFEPVLPLVFDGLPACSLAATALLLWAEAAVVAERAEAIVRGVLAASPAERDVDAVVGAFAQLATVVTETSREWSRVLLVQLLLFGCAAGIGVLIILRPNDDDYIAVGAAVVVPVVWPLLLSFSAVVRLNAILDAVPSRITTALLFSSVERAAFADDYARLRMRLRVLGIELTTQRLGGLLLSALGATLFAVLRASLDDH
jgi:hypothetical protein